MAKRKPKKMTKQQKIKNLLDAAKYYEGVAASMQLQADYNRQLAKHIEENEDDDSQTESGDDPGGNPKVPPPPTIPPAP